MLRLYLVRHGWTAWHSEERIAGWADVPLDQRGQAEADATGRWLARCCRGRPLALVTSPVLRARQTAEAIAVTFAPPLEAALEPGIAETRLPAWEGRLARDIIANDPIWQDFYRGPADFRYPDGETGREVQARVVAAVLRLQERHEEGELILVAHADPLRGLIAHYLGMDANRYYRLRIQCGSISRLSLRRPESHGPGPPARLDFLNLTEHLAACAPEDGSLRPTSEDEHDV